MISGNMSDTVLNFVDSILSVKTFFLAFPDF